MLEQTSRTKSRITLVLLALMFFLPVAGSWYLVFFTDYAREDRGIERGDLIKPPRQLEDVGLIWVGEDAIKEAFLYGKWSMLFFTNTPCLAGCEEGLYRLRQIRLATGRRMQKLQRIAIIDGQISSQFRDNLREHFPGQLYTSKHDLGDNFLRQFQDQNIAEQGAIFLIDPRGFLMMRYSSHTDPTDIIHDLSRLLRISI